MEVVPIDIAADYDAIVCQIRNGSTSDAPLIKSVTLEAGE